MNLVIALVLSFLILLYSTIYYIRTKAKSFQISSLINVIKNIKTKKELKKQDKISINHIFQALGKYMVVCIFYNMDIKYAIVVPVMGKYLLNFPCVFEIDDKDNILYEKVNLNSEVFEKAFYLYDKYKDLNENKFYHRG